ncbi:ATP-dependent dethiobiotin synthetase BioD [Kerstersia similis]
MNTSPFSSAICPSAIPARPPCTLLFVHGWAFDAGFWSEVRAHLAKRLPQHPQITLDAGYFTQDAPGGMLPAIPHVAPPSPGDGPCIAIGHSLGAMRLLGAPPAGCAGLILINGFACFSRQPDHAHGTPPRVLTRMMEKLAQAPGQVVDDFRARCGAPAAAGLPVAATLASGLLALRDQDERAALAALALPIRLLAGHTDPLIPPAMSRAMSIQDTHWHAGGHLLPLTDSAWCADRIAEFVQAMGPNTPAKIPENTLNLAVPQAVTHKLIHKPDIARRFNASAAHYEQHASVQQHAAQELARRIARLPLPPHPRILEIGCGTGLLTRALAHLIGPATWTLTDISPAMLNEAQRHFPGDEHRFLALDGEHPAGLDAHYDLICSSLAVQWFDDLNAGLARLAAHLAPGGWLALNTLAAGTFREWRDAHEQLGWRAGTRSYPPATHIGRNLPFPGHLATETLCVQQSSGLDFLRGLKAIGATCPADGHTPLSARQLRAVLQQFDKEYEHVSYEIAYGAWRRPPAGVFVTGTDTGVGKTLVSAVLAHAWQADYWKPLQTGLAEESGDTETVARLAWLPPERLHPPGAALQAPLSPWAAAMLEHTTIDINALQLPATPAPLVVEGAGGLLVPIDAQHLMLDLISRFGLPVVLVARSGLGTINHTLLSLRALADRQVPVLGVIMSGPPSPGNRQAIEHFGKVRVLAEFPHCDTVDAKTIARFAAQIPSLSACHETAG